MSVLFIVIAIVAYVVLSFGPLIAGSVMARRAWKRNDWLEMRLAYRGFISLLAIAILGYLALLLIGSIVWQINSVAIFRLASVVIAVLNGIATVLLAWSMYRLARRGFEAS